MEAVKTKIERPGHVTEAFMSVVDEPEVLTRRLTANFRNAYRDFWPTFMIEYIPIFDDVHRRVHYAKSHALIDAVIAAIVAGVPHQVIFECYQKFIWSNLSEFEQVRLQTQEPKYFWRVIRNCRQLGIAKTIVHGNCDPSEDFKVRLTEIQKERIRLSLKKSFGPKTEQPELLATQRSSIRKPLHRSRKKSQANHAGIHKGRRSQKNQCKWS